MTIIDNMNLIIDKNKEPLGSSIISMQKALLS